MKETREAYKEKQSHVLIVVPAYNEAKTIAAIIAGLREHTSTFDRIFIDDGSSDKTAAILREHDETVLSLPCNLGYGRALQTGMLYGLNHGYEIFVFFDADGQHIPTDIPVLVSQLQNSDADMIIGSRFVVKTGYTCSRERRIGMIVFSFLVKIITGQRIYDSTSGFKVMRARVAKLLAEGVFSDFTAESLINLLFRGIKIHEYPITVKERLYGESMHSLSSIVTYPLKTLFLILVGIIDVYFNKYEDKP